MQFSHSSSATIRCLFNIFCLGGIVRPLVSIRNTAPAPKWLSWQISFSLFLIAVSFSLRMLNTQYHKTMGRLWIALRCKLLPSSVSDFDSVSVVYSQLPLSTSASAAVLPVFIGNRKQLTTINNRKQYDCHKMEFAAYCGMYSLKGLYFLQTQLQTRVQVFLHYFSPQPQTF